MGLGGEMKRFSIKFDEEYYGYIGFTAESPEEAQKVLEQLEAGEIDERELPNYWRRDKSGNTEFSDLTEEED